MQEKIYRRKETTNPELTFIRATTPQREAPKLLSRRHQQKHHTISLSRERGKR